MTKHQLPEQIAGLSRLVQIEWEVRQAGNNETINYIAVNDTHRLIGYDHGLIWLVRSRNIVAVSGSLKVEPQAPQMVWFSKVGKYLSASKNGTIAHQIDAQMLPKALGVNFSDWIGGQALWVPLCGPRERLEGGMFLLREKSFNEAELRMLTRLGNAYGSAYTALNAPVVKRQNITLRRRLVQAIVIVAIIGLAAVRLPMTVLAEARVAPSEPMVVSAPIEGVIAQILVKPNQVVTEGEVLLRFDQTQLFASRDVAFKRVAVLSADSQRSEAQAFSDPKARAQISLLRAKLAEGRAELDFAQKRLEQTELRASARGIALIDDVNEWVGRPVKIGERIMVIADPQKALLEIDVSVEDASFVRAGAQVEYFLATAPAQPIKAQLRRISYSARLQPDQTTKFIAEAVFTSADKPPRLGLTGTAKIYGPRVSLAYLLFRKPLAKLRRLLGV